MHHNGDDATRLSRHCSMRHEYHAGTTIVHLSGEFDLSSEDRFKEELGRVMDSETQSFVLDLRGLEFIDSTGLRLLVQLDALARQDGFDFSVLCGNGQVREVLRISGLDGVMPLIDPSGVVPPSDSPV